MKKLKYTLFLAVSFLIGNAYAQRNFVGAGFGLLSQNYPGENIKFTGSTVHLMYTHYSSPRRGSQLDVSPLMAVKMTTVDGKDKTLVQKTGGYSFGWSVFGLIATDYQSKLEVGLINTLRFVYYPDIELSDINLQFGLMARYRLNPKMKLGLELAPMNMLTSYGQGISFGPTAGFRFYYAP